MNSDFQIYQIISAYLDNRLSQEDRLQFEEDMERDPELRQLVEDFPLIEEALNAAAQEEEFEKYTREEASKMLKQIYNSGFSLNSEHRAKVIPIHRKNWFRYAAAVIIIITILSYPTYNFYYKKSPQQLFATNYSGYPNVELLNTRGSNDDNMLETRIEAYEYYNNQQFEEFIQAVEALSPDYPEKLNDRFYLGIAYLETQQWQNAVITFEALSSANFKYSKEVDWFLGMAYLGIGACENAKTTLEKVKERGPDNQEKATSIISRIDC